MQDIPLTIDHKGRHLTGIAVPLGRSALDQPTSFDIIIDKAFLGTLRWHADQWRMDTHQDPQLVDKIGKYILAWYVRPIDGDEDPDSVNGQQSSDRTIFRA